MCCAAHGVGAFTVAFGQPLIVEGFVLCIVVMRLWLVPTLRQGVISLFAPLSRRP